MTPLRKALAVAVAVTLLLALGAGAWLLLGDEDDNDGSRRPEPDRAVQFLEPLPASVTYVALGDSIAAGFGLGGPAEAKAECGRSSGATVDTKAYTDIVRDELTRRFPDGVTGEKLACGGANTNDMALEQVDAANGLIGDSAAVITITIGANNYSFTDPATYSKALSPDERVYRPWREGIETRLRRELTESLVRLGADKPLRRILVTHYYDPFNHESVVYTLASTCSGTGGSRPSSVDCRDRTAEIVDGLNDAIEGAADDYRSRVAKRSAEVTVVEGVTDTFEGHEGPRPNCGSAAPDAQQAWVQAPPRALVVEYLSGGDALERGQDCFHLNAEGHRQLATLVTARLPRPGS